ncbi:MAG: citramalate synthase, partial [Dehalococcoidales bacterium]
MSTVQLYDTTLRDGAQREGISFSVVDKLHIAARLDELGVRFIEGGWPGANPKDDRFFRKAGKLKLKQGLLVELERWMGAIETEESIEDRVGSEIGADLKVLQFKLKTGHTSRVNIR